MNGNLCPVKGCQVFTKTGHLLCAGHWRMVPRELQSRVWNAWSDYKAAMRPSNVPENDAVWDEKLRITRAYQDATRDATAAVDRKAR